MRTSLLALASLLVLAGCADQPQTTEPDPVRVSSVPGEGSETCSSPALGAPWPSGTIIQYYVTESLHGSSADAGAQRWNDPLSSTAGSSDRPGRYPRFSRVYGSSSANVSFYYHPSGASSSSGWAGVASYYGYSTTPYRVDYCTQSGTGCSFGAGTPVYGYLASTTAHELGHVLGFKGHPSSGSCIMNPLNIVYSSAGPAGSEIEAVKAHYNALTVQGVSVGPAAVEVGVGKTATLTGTATLSDGGRSAHPSEFVWSSSNPAVATVSASGVVTGQGVGTASITATSRDNPGASGAATVTVRRAVASIAVSPSSATLYCRAGQPSPTQDFHATAYDASGTVVTVPAAGWSWSFSTSGVANFTVRDGSYAQVEGWKGGGTYVQATADGVTGSAYLYVDTKYGSCLM